MNITVSGYNRPDYLRQACDALARCVGIEDCRVFVLLDPCDETEACRAVAIRHGWECFAYEEHAGCNNAILAALMFGFETLGGDYHVHFEDDCVPTRDALLWFSWARDRYRHDQSVFTVSGYRQKGNTRLRECRLRRWFTPWGWATWPDRFAEMKQRWSAKDGPSWDIIVNHVVRGTRWEACPWVSRVQNIGAERGVHVPDAEWHRANHHVPITADDLGDEVVLDFVEAGPLV